jgi:hypothetical protein
MRRSSHNQDREDQSRDEGPARIAETPIRPDMASLSVFLGVNPKWMHRTYSRVLSQENSDDSEIGRARPLRLPHNIDTDTVDKCSVGR